ncbi:ankyrin repeat domain-containing protein [Amycolatopsis sp. NPDC051903]|uniref:ankyrin repeat domain-containing protein n=1 Tax=Amycolatopsis sp. NPDC051903 TaxID=3363936 RepID=UPI0037971C86
MSDNEHSVVVHEQLHQRARAVMADLARDGNTQELADFLDHGLDVNALDAAGNSLLMLAAYHGRLETVRYLLTKGADPDICNARGQAAIAGALFKGEHEIVAALKEAGADLDLGTPTAREAATMFGQTL